jgi:signal transduction histidine kinase
MAAAARAMDAADRESRLPVPATRDELADLSQAFNGLLDRLDESFERQRRFTGDASHQLRTPLTALLGQIEVALRREREADDYRQVLTRMQQQARHLQRIVESLLFLTRADAEAHAPERERLDLGVWLSAHLQGWSEHPRAGDLHIELEHAAQASDTSHLLALRAPEPFNVAVQPVLLGELVDLLLENACKYSPPGTPITLRLEHVSGQVRLSIEDQGGGIAAKDLPHLCEPFYRAPDARRRGIAGLGLGLAIAKRIAEAFGGRLVVASQEGKGSCFTVEWPTA